MRVTPKVRKTVYERDGFQCVHCGAMSGLTLQHRASAGMGGSKTLHVVENLLCFCWDANTRLESDAAFAEEGRVMGWKINRHQDPLEVPVWFEPEGEWYYLTDRGTRILADMKEGERP